MTTGTDRRRAAGLLLFLALTLEIGCGGSLGGAPRPAARVTLSDGWLALGTFFDADLRVPPKSLPAAQAWLEAQRTELPRLEAVYSRHDPASELSRVNASLRTGSSGPIAIEVTPELYSILETSLEVWSGSGGGFEPTIAPLVAVWTEAARTGTWPGLGVLRKAKTEVGSDALSLAAPGRLRAARSGLQLDLDGLSKGAALDHLAASFREAVPGGAALLSLGESSVFAIGDPEGRLWGGGWRLEVQSRDERGTRLATIALRDRALSVSSSLGKTSEIDGVRVSHVVDPRTGIALDRAVEAVVVAERAGLADAWSTALLVLGAQRDVMRLVERADLEAYVFEEGGRIAASKGWERLDVTPDSPPSVESGPPAEGGTRLPRSIRPD